jgi:HD-GYP domain-containing protein (c-di-GMP phosphodiesterase class II)
MEVTRQAELLGRLSLAFDIANDSPRGKAVRSVVLATELGASAGASGEELRDTYWVSLLGYLGCTGFACDEEMPGGGEDRAVRAIAMCETSIRLAEIIGPGSRILHALHELCERWDGRGVPGRVKEEAMALPMRLQQIGHVAEVAHHRGGREEALAVIRRRAERQFDPRLVDVFVRNQRELFAAIEDPHIFERFLQLEPEPVAWADEERTDDLAHALAIYTDLQSPIFLGHSTGVKCLAEQAAGHLGLVAEETRALRRAALLHDVGRLSVPNSIWTRPGPLDWSAWEQVRLHSYYTERVLSPIQRLGPVAAIAGAAHERVDGSGYHESRLAKSVCRAARVLAAADAAFAMSEDRPHRPALKIDAIARQLVAEVGAGRLDPTAVDAVLASLGLANRIAPTKSHGLSDREFDVARLLVRGKTNKEIGEVLGISPRTVQIHVAHIFDKLGVHSRSGAAIWLVEHDLAT